MIAKNFRKYPEAMAMQLVLAFGRPVWNTSRPTTRIGRALRLGKAAIVKATPQLVAWVKVATPEWFKAQAKRAKALAALVRDSIDCFTWELVEIKEPKPLEGVEKLMAEAVNCKREYSHTFCPITSVMKRPHWGERWIHGRMGTIFSITRNHNYRENF